MFMWRWLQVQGTCGLAASHLQQERSGNSEFFCKDFIFFIWSFLQSVEAQLKANPDLANTLCHYSGLRQDDPWRYCVGGMVRGGYCCLGVSISLFSLNDDLAVLYTGRSSTTTDACLRGESSLLCLCIVVAFWVIWWYPKSDHCDQSAVPSLLTEYKVNPNSRSRAGQTPLHIAAIYGRSLSWLSWHGGWNWGKRKNILTNRKEGDLQRLDEQVRSRWWPLRHVRSGCLSSLLFCYFTDYNP